MKLEGKKFVVIGGAGLIGSHYGGASAEDVGEIVVFDNFVRGTHENLAKRTQDDPRVHGIRAGGDICQTDVLSAALAAPTASFTSPRCGSCNATTSRAPRSTSIFAARSTYSRPASRNGVGRLVYWSSASVYGDAVEEPMTEDHPFNFANFYGATKVAGEAMARSLHGRYGLDYVGLRYMNVYGPARITAAPTSR